MKKRVIGIALFAALSLPFSVYAQESGSKPGAASTENSSGPNLGLMWFNFAVVAAGLGYLIAKKGPAFFNARTAAIQKAIKDATGLKMDADFRSAEIDRKMATLGAEVSRLRADAGAEMQAEQQRLAQETAQSLARIEQHVIQELAALEHDARLGLRRHIADLAVSMASSRLRDHLTPSDHDILVTRFAGQVSAHQPGGGN